MRDTAQARGGRSSDKKLLVGGKWVEGSSGEWIESTNPATEQPLGRVPKGTREDAKAALEAAAAAQPAWEAMPAPQRAKILYKTYDLIQTNAQDMARLLSMEQGKPLPEAQGEVQGTAEHFEYFAGFGRRIEGTVVPSDSAEHTVLMIRKPMGVVAAMTPWNFPAAMVARKLCPSLITGNTVVLKPSSETPLIAYRVVEALERAGLPKGVVNLVTGPGSEVGDELTRNPLTNLVTITGSTESGKRVYEAASQGVKRLVLELGGKAPFIVWKDADMAVAVRAAVFARFWNAGQTCINSERTYVHEDIYQDFTRKYVKAVEGLRMGDPLKPGTDIGPLVSEQQLEKTEEAVRRALDQGAELLVGGERPPNMKRGYYYEPTVLDRVEQDSEIMQEEVFGPVTPLKEFSDFDEAIRYANDSHYGLASYIFTQDARIAMKAAQEIKFGETYVNQVGPELLQGYHTGWRESGIGGEGSTYGLENYTQVKTVYWNYSGKLADYIFPYGPGKGSGTARGSD